MLVFYHSSSWAFRYTRASNQVDKELEDMLRKNLRDATTKVVTTCQLFKVVLDN